MKSEKQQPLGTIVVAIKPGATVKIGGRDGLVSALSIAMNKSTARYEVVWWDGATRKSEWVDECELSDTTERIQIGFGG